MDYSYYPKRHIAILDMVSFYASCTANIYGLDVMKVPIAVVANLEQRGSVVLAASPPMKKRFSVKTGTRLYEIPKHPEIRLFHPQMNYFLEMSMKINAILHKYVPDESIHVYSVDESFIDLTGTEKLWGKPEETVKHIQKEILTTLNIPTTAGMGPNMLIAKLALDLEAKKTGFSKWEYEDIPKKLWPVSPLNEMWGIGSKTEKHLNQMGIFTVGQLAHTDLSKLKKKFGIMGSQLYHHAWGIDMSTIGEPIKKSQVSYGKSQILMRDYINPTEVKIVILEMCEDVASRVRSNKCVGRTISLSIGYSRQVAKKGFRRSRTISESTNSAREIYEICVILFDENYENEPVRQIALSLSKLEKEHSVQLSLFEPKKWEDRRLNNAMDKIKNTYGSTAIIRAASLTEAGTTIKRSKLVGGHKK